MEDMKCETCGADERVGLHHANPTAQERAQGYHPFSPVRTADVQEAPDEASDIADDLEEWARSPESFDGPRVLAEIISRIRSLKRARQPQDSPIAAEARIEELKFALGAADLDIRGWFDRAEAQAERAIAAEARIADLERVGGVLLDEYDKEQEEDGFPFNFALRAAHADLRALLAAPDAPRDEVKP